MVSFAKQGLLMDLDGYAAQFGWDEWPVPQLDQNRVDADGCARFRHTLRNGF